MKTRTPPHDTALQAPRRRRAVIAVSLALAALLNAAAIGMASQRAPLSLPTGPAASRVTLVSFPPGPPQAAAAELARLAISPLPAPQSQPTAQIEASAQAVALPSAPSPIVNSAVDVQPADNSLVQPVRFYSFNEVDRAAEPDADWPIDIETLDAIGIARLVFEVLVDDRGTVIACAVLDPTGLPEAAKRELEERLSATSLRPALREGRFVASQRRIELLIEPNT